jgi:hypothetical protein
MHSKADQEPIACCFLKQVECTLIVVVDPQTRLACVRLSKLPSEPLSHCPPAPGVAFAGEMALRTGSGCLLHVPEWPAALVHAHLPSLFAESTAGQRAGGGMARELLVPGAKVRAEVLSCEGSRVHARLVL